MRPCEACPHVEGIPLKVGQRLMAPGLLMLFDADCIPQVTHSVAKDANASRQMGALQRDTLVLYLNKQVTTFWGEP